MNFEVLRPSGDVNLFVRKGVPLPDATKFHYQSARSSTNDESIIVFPNSTVPLTPGDWYLGVVHNDTNVVTYEVRATEFATAGTNVIVTRLSVVTNSLCITWTNAVPGLNYFVQGKSSLQSLSWVATSPTLLSTNPEMTYCIPLPTVYQFFRVAEGAVPAAASSMSISSMLKSTNGFSLQWNAPAGERFSVEWTPSLSPLSWSPFTNVVTSTNGTFRFTDDGSQTGGTGLSRFYRILELQ